MDVKILQENAKRIKHLKDTLQVIFRQNSMKMENLPLEFQWWRMNYYVNSWKYRMPVYNFPITLYFTPDVVAILGDLAETCVIAGGALNPEYTPEDIDIFVLNFNNEVKKKIIDKFIEEGAIIVCESIYAVSMELNDNKIQIIKRDYSSPGQIINCFDHSICKIAYYKKKVYFTIDYYFAKSTSSISVNYRLSGIGYINRLSKYHDKGIKIICPEIRNSSYCKFTIKDHIVQKIWPENYYTLCYGDEERHYINGYQAVLNNNIKKCNVAPIKMKFTIGMKMQLMEEYKCYISNEFLAEKKLEFEKIIRAREQEIRDYYSKNMDGPMVARKTNFTITAEEFYQGRVDECAQILTYKKPYDLIYLHNRLAILFYIRLASGNCFIPKFLIMKIMEYL